MKSLKFPKETKKTNVVPVHRNGDKKNTKKSNVLFHYIYVVKIACPPLLFNYKSNQQLLCIAMALNNILDETTYTELINRCKTIKVSHKLQHIWATKSFINPSVPGIH